MRLDAVDAWWRAANYLAVAQIYLRSNALLRRPLSADDIKPRLLGHWGTVPGLTLVAAHLQRLIQDTGDEILLVVGPGHGAPGVLSELYLEGALAEIDPRFTLDEIGLGEFVKCFSWPGGHPSHVGPILPGTIHEGGELGYSLSHAFGAAFDAPDRIVACVVGDGEAETGPIAAAWHSPKFVDPVRDGAVLPILHLNGQKLSGPTILARMSERELVDMFAGLGYDADIVAGRTASAVHARFQAALDRARARIRALQARARSGVKLVRPHWPLIVLRTPKGWTGPKELDGHAIEGTPRAHQVPIAHPKTNPVHLAALAAWLASYRPHELFDADGRPSAEVLSIVPSGDRHLGRAPSANRGATELALPPIDAHAVAISRSKHTAGANEKVTDALVESTRPLGAYLREIIRADDERRNFRLVCPDETASNRLQDVFDVTCRAFSWPVDARTEGVGPGGRVMEILSEHTCQGWLEGYLLTGRHGLFACYEAFATIVDSMVAQHAKWLKVSREIAWRKPIPSLNYLLTSHSWRQDHNGYSHQGPGFIDTLVSKKSSVVRIYLPPDANTLLCTAEHCFESRDYVNLMIASKSFMPQWLDLKAARAHCARGAGEWAWAGHEAERAEVILACAGDVPTLEIMAAANLLRVQCPSLRFRVVNIVDLFALCTPEDHPHGIEVARFRALFGDTTPVVFAFHGYPRVVHELLHHRPDASRFHVRGYIEEGTTTTPFDMVVRNHMSRFDLCAMAVARARPGSREAAEFETWRRAQIARHTAWIVEHGEDLPEIAKWRWEDA